VRIATESSHHHSTKESDEKFDSGYEEIFGKSDLDKRVEAEEREQD